jgi:hypothetical protein
VTTILGTDLPQTVQKLLVRREQHMEAISKIDSTLAGVTAALNSSAVASSIPMSVHTTPTAKKAVVRKRRGRGRFAISAEGSVVAFIKMKKAATNKEVNEHFKTEGRFSTADNSLSKLVREKKLTRTKLGGLMGSSYALV